MKISEINDLLTESVKIDIHEHLIEPQVISETKNPLASIASMAYLGYYDFYPGLNQPKFKINEINLSDNTNIFLDQLNSLKENNAYDIIRIGINYLYKKDIKSLNKSKLINLNKEIISKYSKKDYYNEVFDEFNIIHTIYDVPKPSMGLNLNFNYSNKSNEKIKSSGLLRINSLLFGFDPNSWNNETNLIKFFITHIKKANYPSNSEEYLSILDQILNWAIKNFSGLKCASAYERILDFGTRKDMNHLDPRRLNILFRKPINELVYSDILEFGNYVFHYILDFIEGKDFPVQIHTGTAIQETSNPIYLRNILKDYKDINFDLLHFGFPYTFETLKLIKEYNNAFSDFVWLTNLDPNIIVKLVENIEKNALWNKIMAFGGDCACIEGSIGSLLKLSKKLSEGFQNLISDEKISKTDLSEYVNQIFLSNPRKFFNLK